MANTQSRRLSRQLRRALVVRRWPLRRKIAVGAWIPVAVVAFALFTGPNRASSTPVASKPLLTTTSTEPVTIPTPTTLDPRFDIGLWIQGKGRRRRETIAGSTNTVENLAQLHLKSYYLHNAVKQAERRAHIARNSAGAASAILGTKN